MALAVGMVEEEENSSPSLSGDVAVPEPSKDVAGRTKTTTKRKRKAPAPTAGVTKKEAKEGEDDESMEEVGHADKGVSKTAATSSRSSSSSSSSSSNAAAPSSNGGRNSSSSSSSGGGGGGRKAKAPRAQEGSTGATSEWLDTKRVKL